MAKRTTSAVIDMAINFGGAKRLFNVEVTLKEPHLNHQGLYLSTLFLKNVVDTGFDADTGVFFATKSDETVYLAPKEEIHHVWIRPADSPKNEVTCETCKNNLLGPGYEPCASCDDNCSNWEGKE